MVSEYQKVRELPAERPGIVPAEVLGAAEPYVIRGLVSTWPLVQAARVSDEAVVAYLKQFYQDKTVVFYEAAPEKKGRIFYNESCSGFDFHSAYAPLDKILDRLIDLKTQERPPTLYVGSTTVDVCLPGLRQHNDLNLSSKNPLVSIWIGNRTLVPAHFDAPDNIACCVAGKRRFTLFPTEQIENLYVGPLDPTPSGQVISMVNVDAPDLEKHPKFSEAQKHALVTELEPGDALYIPSMWWHHVESLTSFNVLVNYWWREVPKYMDSPVNVLHHAIMGLRDLPPREKKAWKTLFDFYIFNDQEGKYDHIPEQARGFLNPTDDTMIRRIRSWLLNKLNR